MGKTKRLQLTYWATVTMPLTESITDSFVEFAEVKLCTAGRCIAPNCTYNHHRIIIAECLLPTRNNCRNKRLWRRLRRVNTQNCADESNRFDCGLSLFFYFFAFSRYMKWKTSQSAVSVFLHQLSGTICWNTCAIITCKKNR